MLEEIELVIDKRTVKLAHAVGVTEKVGPRVGQIFAGTVWHVVRNLDLLHLPAIDRMGAEIARNRRHEITPRNEAGRLQSAAGPGFVWLG